jgi:maltokinase
VTAPTAPSARPAAGTPTTAGDAEPAALRRWLEGRRWFAGAEGDPAAADVVQVRSVALPGRAGDEGPRVRVAVAETAGGHCYQLLLPDRSDRPTGAASTAPNGPRGNAGMPPAGSPMADLGTDLAALERLGRFVASATRASAPGVGTVAGHWSGGSTPLGTGGARLLGAEQSNTSVVVGGTHVLKVFRRLQTGPHPEVEIGRHLAAVAASSTRSAPVAALSGWYELVDEDGGSTALGVVQELVNGALDGWSLVLGSLAADPPGVLARLHDLGRAIALLHDALAVPAASGAASDAEAPEAFGATPLGPDRIRAVAEGTAADAERVLATTIDRPPALARVAGRAGDVRGLADDLVSRLGEDLGSAIRHHGDLHLGQTVHGADGWVILDFEGEPARALAERRLRHSPLRDVAGMLRSLAYAVATHQRAGVGHLSPGWLPAGRAALLDGYLSNVDPDLVPVSAVAVHRLLTLFELEKVVYEIGYELAHRPDWVVLPVAGLRTLLDQHEGAST